MRKTMLTTLLVAAAATVFAVTGPLASGAPSKGARAASAPVKVTTRSVSGLGQVLVNGAGRTLYMFEPDKDKKVTCFSACAKIWPPLFVSRGLEGGRRRQREAGADRQRSGQGRWHGRHL